MERSVEAVREHRRAEQQASTRQSILSAAARVFLRQGFQKATMREIAREAGFTASSLYTYFPSKEALFVALRDQLTDRGLETFESPMPAGLSLEQRLELVAHRIAELAIEMKDVMILYVVSKAQLPDETLEEKLQRACDFMNRLAEWLDRTTEPEMLRGHSSQDIAYVFFGMIDSELERTLATGEPTADRVRSALQRALHYTLVMLAGPPAP